MALVTLHSLYSSHVGLLGSQKYKVLSSLGTFFNHLCPAHPPHPLLRNGCTLGVELVYWVDYQIGGISNKFCLLSERKYYLITWLDKQFYFLKPLCSIETFCFLQKH